MRALIPILVAVLFSLASAQSTPQESASLSSAKHIGRDLLFSASSADYSLSSDTSQDSLPVRTLGVPGTDYCIMIVKDLRS